MAFGVVLFTLLAQGTTIGFLLKKLGLSEQPEHVVAREMQLGRLYAAQAGLSRLADLRHDGLLVREVWAGLRDEYEKTSRQLSEEMVQLLAKYPDLEREILLQARREALEAERAALGDALRQGLISERVYRELTREVIYSSARGIGYGTHRMRDARRRSQSPHPGKGHCPGP
jgi:CPA1 family monovalent cation:H+ antiporter